MGIDDVDLKTLPFPEMVAALENGAIHCGIVTEPFATLSEQKGVGMRPYQAQPGARPVPITMLFWNSDWAKKNEATARAFMAAYLRGVRDLSEADAWRAPAHLEILQKYTRVAPEVLVRHGPLLQPEP